LGNRTSTYPVVRISETGSGKPIYGKLLGNDEQQAVIFADCFLGNGDSEEVFVYGIANGKPALIQRIELSDCAPDRNYYDMQSAIIKNGHLLISYSSGGSHAQPEWIVTRMFSWDGHSLVRGQATWKSYRVVGKR
jgi:hypothetical protein